MRLQASDSCCPTHSLGWKLRQQNRDPTSPPPRPGSWQELIGLDRAGTEEILHDLKTLQSEQLLVRGPLQQPLAGAGVARQQGGRASDRPTSPSWLHFQHCCQVRPQAHYLTSFRVLSPVPPQEGVLATPLSLGCRDSEVQVMPVKYLQEFPVCAAQPGNNMISALHTGHRDPFIRSVGQSTNDG